MRATEGVGGVADSAEARTGPEGEAPLKTPLLVAEGLAGERLSE